MTYNGLWSGPDTFARMTSSHPTGSWQLENDKRDPMKTQFRLPPLDSGPILLTRSVRRHYNPGPTHEYPNA
jgi:hypothetical protein